MSSLSKLLPKKHLTQRISEVCEAVNKKRSSFGMTFKTSGGYTVMKLPINTGEFHNFQILYFNFIDSIQ